MSNAVFPSLPGLTWDGTPVPTWSTIVQTSKNRATTRLMNDPFPLWTFDLSYEFLRDVPPTSGYSELEQVVGFYNARGGSFDDFLMNPSMLTGRSSDGTETAAPIGTGDGTTTEFYLLRNAGGFEDEVQNPVGTPTIYANGAAVTSGLTRGAAGLLTFATAPAAGVVLTWSGSWQWRVRFSEDNLGVKQFMYQLYELQSMKLDQVKL